MTPAAQLPRTSNVWRVMQVQRRAVLVTMHTAGPSVGSAAQMRPGTERTDLPLGGMKRSGYGCELKADINEFMNQKVINGARVAELA